MIHFSGEVVFISGGSRGIGAATAELFSRLGARVAISYHSHPESAERVLKSMAAAGTAGMAVRGDVSSPEDVDRMIAEVVSAYGTIDIMVANAGIWTHGPIDSMTDAVWKRTMDVNLNGVFYLCRAVVPVMKRHGGGTIVTVTSTAGQRGEAFHSHYAASKGAVISLTKSLSTELAPDHITVNSVAPGWVDTEMCDEVFAEKEYKETVRKGIPVGRIPLPEDIAGPIVFLASKSARHITGEILNVNGGSVLCG